MSSEFSKKAVDMLLKGARLVSEPCPYCKGVRVIKDGYAFCVSCGKEPEIKKTKPESTFLESNSQKSEITLKVLEQKLEKISKELELEQDYEKQQQILKSINSLVEIIRKLKK